MSQNQQYTSGLNKLPSNNSSTTGIQFFNPNKQTTNSMLNQHSNGANINSATNLNSFKSSKGFVFKPNPTNDLKGVTNPSTFHKNGEQPASGKFIPGAVNKTLTNNTGSTSNSTVFNSNHNNNKSLNSQMIKSSIQENPSKQETKFKTFESPTRRAPRMSEPMQNRNGNLDVKNVKQQGIESPPTFLKERQRQKEGSTGGFTKFKSFQSPLQNQYKNSGSISPFRGTQKKPSVQGGKKDPSFLKQSVGKKKQKPISMSDFLKIKQLGAGKYGKVFLASQKKTNFVCAVKMIEKQLLKDEQIVEQFIRQLKIQMFLNHPNIIKMFGYFDDETYIYIILQAGTGGQLYHQLKKSESMPEQKVAGYMRQVCQAVNQIHSLRIIHRDIKPQNIVLHQNVIKLCDFGWSVHQDNKLRTTFCGTPLYVCPQILRGKEYDQKIDIWSLGIMMYEMLVGQNPFKITKQQELIKIVKDQIEIPSYVFVSAEGRDFLDKCLQKNPNQRVNIRQLMNHPFFKKHPEKSQKKLQL